MEATEYQSQAARTLIAAPDFEVRPDDFMIIWNALGLAGEAGEVVDAIKKAICHQQGLDRDKLVLELGDVLWYVAALCSSLGLDMGVVMAQNIAKLKLRFPDGWDAAASARKADERGGLVMEHSLDGHL